MDPTKRLESLSTDCGLSLFSVWLSSGQRRVLKSDQVALLQLSAAIVRGVVVCGSLSPELVWLLTDLAPVCSTTKHSQEAI